MDVIPGPSLGQVCGLVGALLQPDPVTKLVAPGAYNKWFLIIACLYLLILPVIAWGVRRRKPAA